MSLPENIRSVQPGGGICYQIELAWGRFRRAYLRLCRRGYVARMAQLRRGSSAGAPHDILDPRDLKYCSNLCTAHWHTTDDPFTWRDRLPVTRWGLAELQLTGWPLLAAAAVLFWQGGWWRWLAIVPAVLLSVIVYFFRDPHRREDDDDPAGIVAPADGKIVEVSQLEDDAFLHEPAVRVGIFLSIFNVHINRAAMSGRVLAMSYTPGEFLNAMNPDSAVRNENMWIGLEMSNPPGRRYALRQVSGLIARRIVCNLRPQQQVRRGEKFGMIKLGSRTELILPSAGLQLQVSVGDRVFAGSTIVGRYDSTQPASPLHGTEDDS